MTRKRRTKAEIEAIDEAIIAVLSEDNPQSVRHVFYRLTDPNMRGSVPKTENGYRTVQGRCLHLRRGGEIPYDWITDATRRGYHVNAFRNPGEFLLAAAGAYRGEVWTADMPHVEVWCESRSIAGVLLPVCEATAVSLYPAGGFTSATLAYEAACAIEDRGRERAVIYYVGDFDPAGVLIDQSVGMELGRHVETPFEIRRLAITEEQISAMGLPTKPRKEGERRRPDIQDTVEAEAMPAATLRGLVQTAIESHLPDGALSAADTADEGARERIRRVGARMVAADRR